MNALFKFLCRTHQFVFLGLSTLNSGRNKPVKEGGQQPPQQNLVSGPRANMAVHQLGSGYIHRSTCEEHQRGKPPLLVASIVQAHHSVI